MDGHHALQATINSDTGSIPGTIQTISTTASELAEVRAETVALRALVAELKASKNMNGRGGRGGRGGRNNAGERPRFRPSGVLGPYGTNDTRTTRVDDGRTTKKFENQNCCHNHGWDVHHTHTSATCMFPDKFHEKTATDGDHKNGCDLYKRLSHKA